MICLRGQLKHSTEWTWTGVWAFGSTIQQEGLPFSYQFSNPTTETKHEPSNTTPTAATTPATTSLPGTVVPDVTKDTTVDPSKPTSAVIEDATQRNPVTAATPVATAAIASVTTPAVIIPAATELKEPPKPLVSEEQQTAAAVNPPSTDNPTKTTSGQTPTTTHHPTTFPTPLPTEIHIQGKTLPASGLWKGSFDALLPSRKGEQRTTVTEQFTIYWKETTTTTSIQVAGTGQNQFGNFKLGGTLDLQTFVLQCHREYIIAPPPAPRSYQTRKRQLSWKRRDVYNDESSKSLRKTTVATAANKKPKTTSQNLTIQIPVIPMGSTKRVLASAGALPSVPDPYMARWRAAHFLYYYTSADSNEPSKYVVYEGDMVHGMRDGRGVCLYNNGLLYEGEWKEDREHGHGTLQSSDRKMMIYQGEWERGRLHGRGTYHYHDASAEGTEQSSEPPRHFYQGEFRENLRTGNGHYQLPDGSVYDGGWRDGTMAGRGVFTWPDGSVYDGDWKDNKRHGHGILRASDGFTYDGTWVNNAMDGRGSATYKNGQEYIGMWSRGRREGRGTINFTNGAVYEGRFRDDAIDGQGTLKISKTLVVSGKPADAPTDKPDFMIPLSFQSDLARIHQMAGFSSIGQ